MIKRILLSILGILLLFAVIAGIKALQIKEMIDRGAAFQLPPEVITTEEAKVQTWESTHSAIATFKAVQGVTVMAEAPGKIVKIGFEAGSRVEKGALLLQQDISTEQAQLKSAEASVVLAETNLDRNRRLLEQKTVSQSVFDSAEAEYKRAMASVEEIKANIEKKTVRAPFAGRLGIRQVNLGEVINTGQAIVGLQALHPIYAEFSLPQQHSPNATGLKVRFETDALPGEVIEGTISIIDPEARSGTRSVRMQAIVPNLNEQLLPGMFAKATVVKKDQKDVLAIPSTAIMFAPYGDSVYVVEKSTAADGQEGLVARQQLVILGERRGDFVAIEKGLKAGDVVASTGVFKLRNGQPVVVNNELAPENQLNPEPADN